MRCIIYEVRNTFGDIHPYVLPVRPGEISDAGVRQQQEKLFYVSPFIEMAMRYHFRVPPPGERVKLRILETDRDGPLLRRPSAAAAAADHGLRCCALFALPLVTLKIVAAIHWEALRLWLKGAAGAASGCRSCERARGHLQFPKEQLCYAGVACPRQSALVQWGRD